MHRRTIAFTLCLGLAVLFISSAAVAQYQLTNLVSNVKGDARHTDPLLVNGWGLAYGPGGPFWISDEGSGYSTLYSGAGVAKSLQVVIPSASGTTWGSPTGIVFNGSQDFQVEGEASVFLFATMDGTISGWSPSVDLTEAIIAVDNSASNASYTGLAITSKASGNYIYAADINNNKIDMYDANFNLVTSFTDPNVPAGTSVFGIQDIDGVLYVSFAPTDESPTGSVDIFREDGTLVKTLATGKPLAQPWGFAVAPKKFGPLSNSLLVSNNTNGGTINGFNLETGQLVGTLKDTNGKEISINQLWGIEFGGGTAADGGKNHLFFTAGPKNNLNGTFGKIVFPKD
jgi:uncharacterized protein (TIGR03118 family)